MNVQAHLKVKHDEKITIEERSIDLLHVMSHSISKRKELILQDIKHQLATDAAIRVKIFQFNENEAFPIDDILPAHDINCKNNGVKWSDIVNKMFLLRLRNMVFPSFKNENLNNSVSSKVSKVSQYGLALCKIRRFGCYEIWAVEKQDATSSVDPECDCNGVDPYSEKACLYCGGYQVFCYSCGRRECNGC
jgi:hypothetical protein